MSFDTRYKNLNQHQRQAVDSIEGPVIVIAGPGTGKTELLGVRAANILKKTDTLPENILCLTFTDSGVAAMRERLIDIIGKEAYKVPVHTFHSFGSEIINQNREFFYNGAIFSPADDIARYQILIDIFDSLDYNNPLKSSMNGEYTHLRDVKNAISDLKRSGLTSDELLAVINANEKSAIEIEKIITPIISGTINKNTHQALSQILDKLQIIADNEKTIFAIEPLCKLLLASLQTAVDDALSVHPTKPITAWKNHWFTKDGLGNYILKSKKYSDKLKALSYVYFEYINKMEQAGLYDYDDMILQVVHALEVNDELRFNLQEKYLYVMIDEFQDTNLAQMRIINSLANSPINEGRPNIMIVGDDDQAIYSFQGANLSNISQFIEYFPSSQIISLRDNYRSTEIILKHSREVITQSTDRLENSIEFLNKELDANRRGDTNVSINEYLNIAEERAAIAKQIRREIDSGATPGEITVLTRKHKEIEALLPYFSHFDINVSYERQDNALDLPPIRILEKIALVVKAVSEGKPQNADSHLPEILSHPAWHNDPSDIWKLSLSSYQNHNLWLQQMEQEEKWQPLQKALIELAVLSLNAPLEEILDLLIGKQQTDSIKMPFFDYFFSKAALDQNPSDYLYYLKGLRRVRSAIQEHKMNDRLDLSDFIELLEFHRKLSIPISISEQSRGSSNDAVNLMTVHKSKGLEFNTVYIFNAVDSVWGEKVRSPIKLIRYPENLPLGYAGDSIDERIRLFYVAMTRAKNNLHISYSKTDAKDKSSIIASFLSERNITQHDQESTIQVQQILETDWNQPSVNMSTDLKQALKPYIESYKLSATHLNAFMDISRGGPQTFLVDKLLHYPTAKSPAACYGSVIHKTLQQAQLHASINGEQKPLEDIIHDFEVNLLKERLEKHDQEMYLQKGSDELRLFVENNPDFFSKSQKSELNFKAQDVVIDNAKLTGVIDVVDIDDESKTVSVIDFKTGKPLESWEQGTEYDKIKAYKYHQQLLFYKILIENSRDFGNLTATEGMLKFIEPNTANQLISLSIDYNDEQISRLKLLTNKVWRHIQDLDFPDTTHYEQNLKGILQFEDDMINDKL